MSKETERNQESDLSLQDRVRKDIDSCDHIGFFTPLGHETFPIVGGRYTIVSSTLCMMCGDRFHAIDELLEKKPDKTQKLLQ